MSEFTDTQNNLLQSNDLSMFHDLEVKYTISSRSWLSGITLKQYGGRGVTRQTLLNREDIEEIYSTGTGLSLTLTNHFFDEQSYQQSYNLLLKHHQQGNSIICENDLLAK